MAKFLPLCEGLRSADRHCDRLVHLRGALDIGLIRDGECSDTRERASVPVQRVVGRLLFLGELKLEAQMATLLHHIQPWMQKSIAESEARVERRMEDMMDRKADIASLRFDVEAILAAPAVEPQFPIAAGSQSAHSSQSESAQATGSHAKSSIGSGKKDQAASSDEATSSESIRTRMMFPLTAGEQNRWCVGANGNIRMLRW
ncbi:hypothetical protein H5410_022416 [Solanum commersonii]|uniref:Uncharacterized protein n=1 Tax=Solanum commersonii TaxID=4109 RepID=A0A9J5ZGP7_SOLCO|nr:hypothetical protein H5410_022416 [Solanum commersonii]